MNTITDDFMTLVNEHAERLIYAHLPARDDAVKALYHEDSYLYWLDAMGVEYLSYINALAKRKNLSLHVKITRANLPAVTSFNRAFYEQWPGIKHKDSRLDDIKHDEKGGYFFTNDKTPIHLAEELAVIQEVINIAEKELNAHNCETFIIASDHGASRLAVLYDKELPYNTDTGGENSGRCCKFSDDCKVPHAIQENGYIILADYCRFKGSRRANVEVHGGASLEEILVPVIALTLKPQATAKVKILNPDKIIADPHEGVKLTLYVSHVQESIRVIIDGKTYNAQAKDDTHFIVTIPEIKRSRKEPYTIKILDGDNIISESSFIAKGRTARVNQDFEDLL